MQMFRHSSADTWKIRKPLERRSTEGRRPSVVDWINGLTDNNNSYKLDSWVERHDVGCERITRNGSVCAVEESKPDESTQHKDQLLSRLKIEIKNIMAEHGAKKFLNINSPYVNSLCVAIDACLMDGLRRRLLTLFNSPSSLTLLQILAKTNVVAQKVLDATTEIEEHSTNIIPNHFIWIREALYMKSLSTIINHFIDSKSVRRYYDNDALLLDSVKGRLVATLLLAPCMVTFRRMGDRIEQEATAEELIEGAARSRTNGTESGSTSTVPSRPPLSITRQVSSIVSSVERNGSVSRDYVFSLHHSCKSTLLYGKNNVAVAMNGSDFAKGYMSLQKYSDGNLQLKWVPNQLMHASSQPSSGHSNNGEFSNFWKNTINIEMRDIIYIHLHQKDECSPACLTFVNCEGVQSAPFQLPAGQHSIAFLSSLETGLAPCLRLDPPLWTGTTKEKMLPRLRKRSTASPAMLDYVFRLVRTSGVEPSPDDIEDPLAPSPLPPIHDNCISLPNSPYIVDNVDSIVNFQIGKACQSMRNQIMARAFYGWLTYVRHLRTIRTHLLHLVDTKTMICDDDCEPITDIFWKKCRQEPTKQNEQEFLKRVYWRGIEGENSKEVRRMAWPYLLGLFEWNEEPESKMEEFTRAYREEIEEWKILEAEVRRRDEEAFIAARARKATSPVREESVMSEVFDDPNEPSCSTRFDQETLINMFSINLHRIDKDVERCDRNLMFFSNKDNLESLRRVMCTYVRRNLEEGYTQGMCDLLAPLLVVFEDEALTLECFSLLMLRQRGKFPQRPGMSKCLLNLRSLIQVVDPQIFGLISDIDYAQALSFAFRWFLLDFKRELSYECTYKVWETIWAAKRLRITDDFAIFFGLATITNYHDVLITNTFDYTDMIKFFNEMAERHDCSRLLSSARTHVKCLQNLVQHLK